MLGFIYPQNAHRYLNKFERGTYTFGSARIMKLNKRPSVSCVLLEQIQTFLKLLRVKGESSQLEMG